jgi:signal transduction histidine kinase
MEVKRAPVSLPVSRSRSGLVLAAMRVVMALLFGLWIWFDPLQPARASHVTGPLFILYLLFGFAMLAIAWRSWWFEFRLARFSFLIDISTFLAGLYFTEAVTLDFFSSFMAFFTFLMLTSATRWNRRGMLTIATVLAVCFLLAGVLVGWSGMHIDLMRFERRFSYLVVLSLMLSWFAFNRNMHRVPRYIRHATDGGTFPLGDALNYAIGAYGAAGGAIAWLSEGETRPHLHRAGMLDAPTVPPPVSLDQSGARHPMLFDGPRGRMLALDEANRLFARVQAPFDGLIGELGVREGLSIPIASRTGRGQLVLCGIRGLCSDDLLSAQGISREIAASIDEEETEALSREVAMSRLRSQIATDLHDSVVQTLAGTKFRLEALRGQIGKGLDAGAEIDKICAGISGEQEHVRAMIDQLRRGEVMPGSRDLRQEILAIAGQLATQWLIAVAVDETDDPIILPTAIIFEVQQIIREAIANAARHGHARTVSIALDHAANSLLSLGIVDDGEGFPADAPVLQPRSIAKRVALLGGTISVASQPGQTRIDIGLPIGRTL